MMDLQQPLVRTSRALALALPLLPEPLRSEVETAHLLYRVIDTLEAATRWSRLQRLEAFADLATLLRAPSPHTAAQLSRAWVAARPVEHDGSLELLAQLPAVISALAAHRSAAREAIARHALRTIDGMAVFVTALDDDGCLRFGSLTDLRGYCYTMAGILGELLTDLYLLDAPALEPGGPVLRRDAALFGEALLLVTILEDALGNAHERRFSLPPTIGRRALLELARDDLSAAATYVLALQTHGAPVGQVRFPALSMLLARSTLDRLEHAARLDADPSAGAPASAVR